MSHPYYEPQLELPAADEFHLAMTEQVHRRLVAVLDPSTTTAPGLDAEELPLRDALERGAICVLTRSSGRDRLTYIVQQILVPNEGDVTFEHGVQFSAAYRRRAKDAVRELGESAGLLYAHSQPTVERPSLQDTDVAKEDLHDDARSLDEDRPYAIAVFGEASQRWTAIGYEPTTPSEEDHLGEAAYEPSNTTPWSADRVRVVGRGLSKLIPHGADATTDVAETAQESSIKLWGEQGQQTLQDLRVGVVGLGGGGSILTEHLARLGVGGLVLVDYDRLDEANLNRAQGATQEDADVFRPKADVAERVARLSATAPDVEIDPKQASVVEADPEYGAVRRLVDCDVIFNAADSAWANNVLDELAFGHLIPVVDLGTKLLVDEESGALTENAKSVTSISGPGHPCLECVGHWRPKKAAKEMENPEHDSPDNCALNDVLDDDDRAMSVVSANATIAGLAQLRFLDLVLGISGHQVGLHRFLPGTWEVKDGIESCTADCDRPSRTGHGDVVNYDLPLGTDHKFKQQRLANW
jgi:hypothetical protein